MCPPLAIGVLLTVAGCGREASSEYHRYPGASNGQSNGAADPSAPDVSPAKSNGNDPAPGAPAAAPQTIASADGNGNSDTDQGAEARPANSSAAADDVSARRDPEGAPDSPAVARVTQPDPAANSNQADPKQADPKQADPAPGREKQGDNPAGSAATAGDPPTSRDPIVAVRPAGPGAASPTAALPRKVQVLIPSKEFKAEGPEGAIRVSYDDIDLLKVLNMEPVTPDAPHLMPAWLKNLDGKRIRIRGFMYPTFQETGLQRFVLARDNEICCFGRDPKIYDVFGVKMRSGETTNYIQGRPFDVVGVFHIRPQEDDGKLFTLYEIDDAIVMEK